MLFNLFYLILWPAVYPGPALLNDSMNSFLSRSRKLGAFFGPPMRSKFKGNWTFILRKILRCCRFEVWNWNEWSEWPIILNSNAHIFWPKGAQKCAHPNFSKKRTNAHIFWPKGAQKCAHQKFWLKVHNSISRLKNVFF